MTQPEPDPGPEDQMRQALMSCYADDGCQPYDVREKLGVSEAELADLIGMNAFEYHQWEIGARRPRGPALKLLELLNSHPESMLAWLRDVD